MHTHSIKQRLVPAVVLLLTLLLGTTAIITYHYFKQQTCDQAMAQQFAVLSTVA